MNADIIGFIAGIIIISAHIPQIIQSLKTRNTRDVNLWLYVILLVAVGMWTVYGIYADFVVFIMNALLMIMISTMIVLKLKYGMGVK